MKKINETQCITIFDADENVSSSNSNRELNAFFSFIVLYIGSLGTVLLMQSCFKFNVNISLFVILIFTICIIPYAIFVFVKYKKRAIFIVFQVFIIFALINYKKVLVSSILAVNQISKKISFPYNLALPVFDVPTFDGVNTTSMGFVLFLFAFLLVMILSYVVFVKHSVIGAMVIPLSIALFCISFDVIPSGFSLVLVSAYVFAVVSMTTRYKRVLDQKIPPLVIGIFILTFLIVYLFIPKLEYKRFKPFETVRLFTEKTFANNSNQSLGPFSTGVGGIDDGKLGQFDSIVYQDIDYFVLTAPNMGRDIYLKSFHGAVYGNNRWDELPDDIYVKYQQTFNDYSLVQNDQNSQVYMTLSGLRADSSVSKQYFNDPFYLKNHLVSQDYTIAYLNNADRNFWLSPYYGMLNSYSKKSKPDGYPINCNQLTYVVPTFYINNIDLSLLKNILDSYSGNNGSIIRYKRLEAEYRTFVYEAYTSLPETGYDDIKAIGAQASITTEEEKQAYILKIKTYLAENYHYTLAPGRVPEGKDFVEYFLNENKNGYCTYFATAATLMFRAAGIPARYVEGYKVSADALKNNYYKSERYSEITSPTTENNLKPSSNEIEMKISKVNISDRSAHAWVEIYQDGLGWIPVEVTPSASPAEVVDQEQQKSDSPDAVDPQDEEPKVDLNDLKSSDQTEITTSLKSQNLYKVVMIYSLIVVIFGLIGLWIFFYVKAKKSILKLLKVKSCDNTNIQIINVYKYMEALCKFLKIDKTESLDYERYSIYLKEYTDYFSECDINGIIRIVLKVRFGNSMASQEESWTVTHEIMKLRKSVYQMLGRLEKIKFILSFRV